jgi:hypothetical protein
MQLIQALHFITKILAPITDNISFFQKDKTRNFSEILMLSMHMPTFVFRIYINGYSKGY